MTISEKLLHNIVDIVHLGLTVGHPNGTHALIQKIGDLKLTKDITLYDVLVVPDYNASLLSVHKLARDNKLCVGFNEHKCYIQDLQKKEIMEIGNESGGLYLFNEDSTLNCKTSFDCPTSMCYVSKNLWHQRLGHPANQVLDALKAKLLFDTNPTTSPCEVCHKAKQTREPFPLSDHKSHNVGELVHLDLWGPYKFDKRIKVLRSDNGTEFVNKNMQLFCDKNDLNHENFFDDYFENPKHPESPNDDGRVSSIDDGTESLTSQEEDGDSRATSMDKNTPLEGITETFLDPISDNSDQPAETVSPRRSSRPSRISAMNNEMEALNSNKTCIITNLPPNTKAIGCKWVYKIKYKSNGEIERYKARLVAKGYSQREGIDYAETFSPVVKMVTVRCLIALAVKNKLDMYQLDVNNAFLYGELKEDVYMTPPLGYFSKSEMKVCKLVKSLYGLKQAPRKWNEKLVLTLSEHGFIKCQSDHSLFIKNTNDIFVALLVYVDDIVITGNDPVEISKVKEFLSSKFQIKDLGKLKYFLGIEILEESNSVFISQRKYCLELLQEFGMLACKPISTPMETNHVMAHLPTEKDPLLTNITAFQKLVGKLIYLTHTRPDISYTVQCLSQRMHAPLKYNLQDALKVLRYLKGSLGKGLRYFSEIQSDPLSGKVVGLTDANWAKCIVTRKSVSVTLSIPLNCDNKSAIKIANNPVFHERAKQFEVDVHFIREKIAKGPLMNKGKVQGYGRKKESCGWFMKI
ncbi:putative RNA-directed DNA polymerase [Tanacetum coccineum]